MDPSHGELKTCPAGARLGFSLHLATLATTRHIEYVIDLKVHLVSSHDVKDGIQSVNTQLLGASVLGDSLGALGHCMLGQLSRQK